MNNDDYDLIQRLRSLDCSTTFDAERLLASIVAIRTRRRRNRIAGVWMAAGLLMSVIAWQIASEPNPIAESNTTRGLQNGTQRAIVATSSGESRVAELGLSLAGQDLRVQELFDRIDHVNALIVEKQQEQERQLVAVYRADASANLTLEGTMDLD